jgi:hypothetical protein
MGKYLRNLYTDIFMFAIIYLAYLNDPSHWRDGNLKFLRPTQNTMGLIGLTVFSSI